MALLKDLIVQGASRFIGDAYFNNIKSGTFYGNLAGGAQGTLFYQSAANTTTTLAIGTEGQVLKVGSGGVPVWGLDSNSDTKVTQTVTNSGNTDYRPLIVGASSSAAASPTFSTVTDTTYATHQLYVKPNTGDFYTKGSINATGGFLTGTFTIETSGTNNYNQGIRINRTAANQWATLLIGKTGDSTSGTGSSTAGEGAWLIATPASSNSLIFNLNDASDSVGLCLKGHGNNDIKWNNNTVWHAGNDGSGSGLDADKLDGLDSTQFVKKQETTRFYPFIATSNGSPWYKVTLAHNGVASGTTRWFMITMELVFGGTHGNGANGKIFLSYFFTQISDGTWRADAVRAIAIGCKLTSNDVKIKYDLANPAIFYVYVNNNTYNSFAIENLTANDSSSAFDYRNTTITTIAAADVPSAANKTVPITKVETTDGSDILLNGNTVAAAAFKGVDTSITSGATNNNVPTSLAVYNYLGGSYLPLSGGTMTGALTTPSLTVTGASSFSQAINGSILGNAATASRWQNARTLTLTGAVTGSVSIDGSANVSLATTVNHNHDDRYYTETESDSRYLKLAGGWMDTDAQIGFKGYNSSTSVYAGIAYLASLGGIRYHLGGNTYNTKGLYIYTNGYNTSHNYGGLAIDNDGVTAFGAGDTGSVFRVVNKDNTDQEAQFAVLKLNGAYVRNNLTVGTQSVDTNSKLAVIGNVRITNSTSNTGCKMEYNATDECLEFNF